MSSAEQQVQQPAAPSGRMIAVLSGIAMLSGFLVVLTAQLTAPIIEENQRRAIEQAILQIIPGTAYHKEYLIHDGALHPAEKGQPGRTIYAGYDQQGKLLGIAAKAGAQGYADMVHLLYGYDPDCECIRGFKVLKMAETPGLGDKIITDPNFQANFPVEAQLDSQGVALLNPIVTVKQGTRKHPWEIDAISGATITSKAVGQALNNSAQELLPVLDPLIGQLKETDQ